jgi:hypothetical protein
VPPLRGWFGGGVKIFEAFCAATAFVSDLLLFLLPDISIWMRVPRYLTFTGAMFVLSLCVPDVARAQGATVGAAPRTEAVQVTKTIVNQKLLGTLYTNGGSNFTLTVPEGWKANDNLVDPRLGAGALTSPDGEADLLISLALTTDDAKTFVKKVVDALPVEFPKYRKVSEAKLLVAGKSCRVLTLAYVQNRQEAGVSVEAPMVSRMVFYPTEYGFLLFNFVTLESIFDKQLPVLDKIMSSYHSTASAGSGAKPE